MAKGPYSDEQLFELGRAGYDKLVLHCQNLEMAGLWEQARQVMKQSSTEVLDVYVQSILLGYAIYSGCLTESQLAFIQTVPISNPLGITEETVIDDALRRDVERMCKVPPVLIQLCSLCDKQTGDDVTEYFIDAILNILRCMEYLDGSGDAANKEYIQDYYNKVSYYVLERSPAEHLSYLNRKLSKEEIVCDVEKKTPPAFEWFEPQKGETEEPEEETELEEEEEPEDDLDFEDEWENEPYEEFEDEEESDEELEPEDEEELDEEDPEEEIEEHHTETGNVAAAALTDEQEEIREKTPEEQEAELTAQAKAQFLIVKKRIMDRERAEQEAHEQKISELMGELNGLVGLESVKQEIQSLINLIKIRKLRSKMNLPEMDMSYHMVFTGSPGTGKTTVARLVAKIYKELGILSEGNLIETDRSGLVAGYVGQTAIKVHEIVEQAIGGILFIDEAYSLANPDVQNDFGTEAVDTLVKLMEDHRDNLVIIVAGYTDEMQNFLKSNTGLISRFNKFIDFPDYSRSELVEIMGVMAENAGLTIEEPAKQRVFDIMEQKTSEEWETFGNARGIRNMFEKFVMNQANRLVMMSEPSKEDLILIKEEDVCV